MNKKIYIGENAKNFSGLGLTEPIGGVLLKVDGETAYRAGDQTGYVLEAECPYGTQAMADALLASLRGRSYEGFEAEGAKLPAGAELGDGVTVKGLYGPLYRRRVRFGAELAADIGAPAGGDMDHEFGYTDPVQRKIELASARTRSYVDRKADEIRVGVESLEKDVRAELDLKVGVDDNGRIVSMLNAAADQINITGDRFVLDSTNFKVAADGTITAKNGEFEGKINALWLSLFGYQFERGEPYEFEYYVHTGTVNGQKKKETLLFCPLNIEGIYGEVIANGEGIDAFNANFHRVFCAELYGTSMDADRVVADSISAAMIFEDGKSLGEKYMTKADAATYLNNNAATRILNATPAAGEWREIVDGSGNKVTVFCKAGQ